MAARGRTTGRFGPALVLIGIASVAVALLFGLRAQALSLNLSASMPIGFYRQVDPNRAPARGDMIEICAPAAIARVGALRGYLRAGSCPFNTSPLLKYVGGVSGDVVDVTANAVRINGVILPGSASTSHDAEGRPLSRIAAGRYVVGAGELWVWSPFPRGWDSRYYGELPADGVRGIVRPVLIFQAEAGGPLAPNSVAGVAASIAAGRIWQR